MSRSRSGVPRQRSGGSFSESRSLPVTNSLATWLTIPRAIVALLMVPLPLIIWSVASSRK